MPGQPATGLDPVDPAISVRLRDGRIKSGHDDKASRWRPRKSRRIIGEPHPAVARAPVGLDVDHGDHPLIHLALPALQRSRVHAELAVVYGQLGREQDAIRAAGQAEELYPDDPQDDPSFLYAEFTPALPPRLTDSPTNSVWSGRP